MLSFSLCLSVYTIYFFHSLILLFFIFFVGFIPLPERLGAVTVLVPAARGPGPTWCSHVRVVPDSEDCRFGGERRDQPTDRPSRRSFKLRHRTGGGRARACAPCRAECPPRMSFDRAGLSACLRARAPFPAEVLLRAPGAASLVTRRRAAASADPPAPRRVVGAPGRRRRINDSDHQ